MRVTKETMSTEFITLCTTMMGIKETVMKQINIGDFFKTAKMASNLGRRENSLEGHLLSEYKLDGRLAPLVYPRGVYLTTDYLSKNLIDNKDYEIRNEGDPEKVEFKEVKYSDPLSPTEFMEVQAMLIGALRKSPEFNTTLEEACAEVELASVSSKLAYGGDCHYGDTPFLPLEVRDMYYSTLWYNMDSKEMVIELIVSILNSFRK